MKDHRKMPGYSLMEDDWEEDKGEFKRAMRRAVGKRNGLSSSPVSSNVRVSFDVKTSGRTTYVGMAEDGIVQAHAGNQAEVLSILVELFRKYMARDLKDNDSSYTITIERRH